MACRPKAKKCRGWGRPAGARVGWGPARGWSGPHPSEKDKDPPQRKKANLDHAVPEPPQRKRANLDHAVPEPPYKPLIL